MRAAGLKGFIKELIKQGGVKSEKYKVQNELMLHGRSLEKGSVIMSVYEEKRVWIHYQGIKKIVLISVEMLELCWSLHSTRC